MEVSFQDEQLEQAIKQLLQKNENESVMQKDMESLTVVNLSGRGIKSVQGLEYASNIRSLICPKMRLRILGRSKY